VSGIAGAGVMVTGGVWALHGSNLDASLDGGSSWTQISLKWLLRTGDRLLATSVIDSRTVVAVVGAADNGDWQTVVRRTSDGGANWTSTDIAPGLPDGTPGLCFVDPTDGVLSLPDSDSPAATPTTQKAPTVLTTRDGGRDWVRRARLPSAGALVAATDAVTFWSWGEVAGSAATPTLSVSRDEGATWAVLPLKVSSGADLSHGRPLWQAPLFVSATSGFVVLRDNSSGVDRMGILRTTDGGSTWVEILAPQIPATQADAASVLDASHWFVAAPGHSFRVYATADSGQSWQDRAATGLGSDWSAHWLHFTDQTHGLMWVDLGPDYGNAPALLVTTDGGRSNWVSARDAAADQFRDGRSDRSTSLDVSRDRPTRGRLAADV
jgi:photosystem II stability/assembly factor-like uncharacterized protein